MGKYWNWPNVKAYLGYYEEGQQFGKTSVRRGRGYFHDGFDFGSAKYPDQRVLAIHDGKVVYANWYGYGMGTVVVTKNDSDGYYIVYQEFGNSTADISVKVGQTVKMGQIIGYRKTYHLHLGITKKEWQSAQASWDLDDGTWLNPIKIIQEDKAPNNPQNSKYYQSGNYFIALKDLQPRNKDFSKDDTTWFLKAGTKFAVRDYVISPTTGAAHALIAGLDNTYVTMNKEYVKAQ